MLTRSIAKLRICSPLVRTPTLSASTWLGKPQDAAVHLLQLPRELLCHLFAFLPLPVCGQLCLTSSSVRERVLAWISSPSFLKQATARLLREENPEMKFNMWLQLCRQFGFFCKCVDMTESPSVRVMRLICLYQQLEEIGCAGLAPHWTEMQSKAGFAAALFSLTLGWHNLELSKVFSLLSVKFDVLRHLQDSTFAGHIMSWTTTDARAPKLRAALRTLFWDFHVDEASQAAWLGFILRKFSKEGVSLQQGNFTSHGLQAILLFFMLGSTLPMAQLGPGHDNFQERMLAKLESTPDHQVVQWQPLAQSYAQARLHFGDLGKALRVLESYKEVAGPGGRGLFRLMVTMFQGNGWAVDNTAACLLFSSEAVVKQFLEGFIALQDQTPMVEVLVALILVCEALSNSLNVGLLNIIDYAFNTLPQSEKQRKGLIEQFWAQLVHRLEFDDHHFNQGVLGLDVMVELGLHLGRRAFPVDAGVQKNGPARKREDKGKLKRRNCPMEVEE